MTKHKLCNYTGLRYKLNKRTNWNQIDYSHRIISFEISLNNPKCTGLYLECIMNWAKNNFTEFYFCLGDTLNSYTDIVLNEGEINEFENKDWYDSSKKFRSLGDNWILENIENINSFFGSNYKIFRWEEWRNHALFKYYFDTFLKLKLNNTDFRKVIYDDISDFLLRKGFKSISSDKIDYISNYILEELSVYTIQARQENIVNVYPGSAFKIFSILNEIEGVPEELKNRNFVYMDVKL
jgi:hypothetical protein